MTRVRPSASVLRPPSPSEAGSSSGLTSPIDLDTETEIAWDAELGDPDVILIGGQDRHSDSPAPGSPSQDRRLEDAVRRVSRPPRTSPTPASTFPPAATSAPGDVDPHAAGIDDEVNLGDAEGFPTCRPRLRLTDLVDTVRCTTSGDVSAVAAQLESRYSFDWSREQMQTILVCMYAARLDVACHLRDLAMQHALIGLTPDQVLLLAFGELDAMVERETLPTNL